MADGAGACGDDHHHDHGGHGCGHDHRRVRNEEVAMRSLRAAVLTKQAWDEKDEKSAVNLMSLPMSLTELRNTFSEVMGRKVGFISLYDVFRRELQVLDTHEDLNHAVTLFVRRAARQAKLRMALRAHIKLLLRSQVARSSALNTLKLMMPLAQVQDLKSELVGELVSGLLVPLLEPPMAVASTRADETPARLLVSVDSFANLALSLTELVRRSKDEPDFLISCRVLDILAVALKPNADGNPPPLTDDQWRVVFHYLGWLAASHPMVEHPLPTAPIDGAVPTRRHRLPSVLPTLSVKAAEDKAAHPPPPQLTTEVHDRCARVLGVLAGTQAGVAALTRQFTRRESPSPPTAPAPLVPATRNLTGGFKGEAAEGDMLEELVDGATRRSQHVAVSGVQVASRLLHCTSASGRSIAATVLAVCGLSAGVLPGSLPPGALGGNGLGSLPIYLEPSGLGSWDPASWPVVGPETERLNVATMLACLAVTPDGRVLLRADRRNLVTLPALCDWVNGTPLPDPAGASALPPIAVLGEPKATEPAPPPRPSKDAIRARKFAAPFVAMALWGYAAAAVQEAAHSAAAVEQAAEAARATSPTRRLKHRLAAARHAASHKSIPIPQRPSIEVIVDAVASLMVLPDSQLTVPLFGALANLVVHPDAADYCVRHEDLMRRLGLRLKRAARTAPASFACLCGVNLLCWLLSSCSHDADKARMWHLVGTEAVIILLSRLAVFGTPATAKDGRGKAPPPPSLDAAPTDLRPLPLEVRQGTVATRTVRSIAAALVAVAPAVLQALDPLIMGAVLRLLVVQDAQVVAYGTMCVWELCRNSGAAAALAKAGAGGLLCGWATEALACVLSRHGLEVEGGPKAHAQPPIVEARAVVDSLLPHAASAPSAAHHHSRGRSTRQVAAAVSRSGRQTKQAQEYAKATKVGEGVSSPDELLECLLGALWLLACSPDAAPLCMDSGATELVSDLLVVEHRALDRPTHLALGLLWALGGSGSIGDKLAELPLVATLYGMAAGAIDTPPKQQVFSLRLLVFLRTTHRAHIDAVLRALAGDAAMESLLMSLVAQGAASLDGDQAPMVLPAACAFLALTSAETSCKTTLLKLGAVERVLAMVQDCTDASLVLCLLYCLLNLSTLADAQPLICRLGLDILMAFVRQADDFPDVRDTASRVVKNIASHPANRTPMYKLELGVRHEEAKDAELVASLGSTGGSSTLLAPTGVMGSSASVGARKSVVDAVSGGDRGPVPLQVRLCAPLASACGPPVRLQGDHLPKPCPVRLPSVVPTPRLRPGASLDSSLPQLSHSVRHLVTPRDNAAVPPVSPVQPHDSPASEVSFVTATDALFAESSVDVGRRAPRHKGGSIWNTAGMGASGMMTESVWRRGDPELWPQPAVWEPSVLGVKAREVVAEEKGGPPPSGFEAPSPITVTLAPGKDRHRFTFNGATKSKARLPVGMGAPRCFRFEHVEGSAVCEHTHPHVRLPDGRVVHHYHVDSASVAVLDDAFNTNLGAPTEFADILRTSHPPPPLPPVPTTSIMDSVVSTFSTHLETLRARLPGLPLPPVDDDDHTLDRDYHDCGGENCIHPDCLYGLRLKFVVEDAVEMVAEEEEEEEDTLSPADVRMFVERKTWAAARSLVNTVAIIKTNFEGAWTAMMKGDDYSHVKHSLDMSDEPDDAINPGAKNVIEANWHLIGDVFDYYSALGTRDEFSMQRNGFSNFLTDIGIVDHTKKHLSLESFSRIWSGISEEVDRHAASVKWYTPGSMYKGEFISCLMRIASAKYRHKSKHVSLAEALDRLFKEHFNIPRFEALRNNADVYRSERIYTAEVNDVLEAHSKLLRALHKTYAQTTQIHGNKRIQRPTDSKPVYMSLWGWLQMLEDVKFMDEDFTRREAVLAFKWSRMVSDVEYTPTGYVMSTHLLFPDFLEALVRMSEMKATPASPDLSREQMIKYFSGRGRRRERRDSSEWFNPKTRPAAGKLLSVLMWLFDRFDHLVGNHDGRFTPSDLTSVRKRLSSRR